MVSVTEELSFYFYFFLINSNVNSHRRLLTVTLDYAIIGRTDRLCGSEDLANHPYLFVYISLVKIKTFII